MAAGFSGAVSPTWTDMSQYLVHFTKDYKEKTAYENMLSILYKRVIRARNPYGIGRKSAPDKATQKVVCFSEVPLGKVTRIAKHRSEYGIVFQKDLLIHWGGNPIMYAYKDRVANLAFQELMDEALHDGSAAIWKITPFIDAPGKYGASDYFFEWEREWRKVGHFEFDKDDVEFLIIPEKLHDKARAFFVEAKRENSGPSYDCPLIDASWDEERRIKEYGY
jgi:hypothetical protein